MPLAPARALPRPLGERLLLRGGAIARANLALELNAAESDTLVAMVQAIATTAPARTTINHGSFARIAYMACRPYLLVKAA